MKLSCYVFLTLFLSFSCMVLKSAEFSARLNYRICVPDKPSTTEITAAKELAAYLEKTYTEKIRLNKSDEPIIFSVGFAPEAGEFSKNKDAFTESGFGVFCRKRSVLLTGLDDTFAREEGTLLSTFAIDKPIKRTGFVGRMTSVNPSAMQ